MSMATGRLKKEAMLLARDPPPFIRAKPLEKDVLEFHYVIDGAPGTPYEGGRYHGQLRFPPEYPMKPPSVLMLTPSGRFQPGTRLCMSMSDFHPETWNPVWSVSTILVGLQSFMNSGEQTTGSIVTDDAEKVRLAKLTGEANDKNKEFCALWPELVGKR
jgi:ubiquitin-conjugating enzyme E2 J2